ncbi:MAG: DUF192 domain-containing protein [Nanoarchaeota archaeon]|nr:DUF192 domain-containing protein [Nanoarchaeota archaeon]MBU1051049.1 DUF192 domain-containing protein [Nanoarchaeota archaeon]MBU1988104.1 DUF192 domain-containing protein [Nanoarchaeota archaeon]
MKINFNKKWIDIDLRKTSQLGKVFGLMFKSSKTQNLLFEFSDREIKTIHSFFVFFPFLAVWLDKKNKVLDYKLVKPFTLAVNSKTAPKKLIEIPLNNKNKKIVEIFVGKGKI